jgi:Zn finger protein HypA/HybF involved in hydrogenase expression
MMPLQGAKAHCANYQPDGSCLGIYYNDDLSVDWSRYEPIPKCLLGNCDACPYFEEIVLPQVPASIGEQYRKSLPAGAKTTVRPRRGIKLCPDCHKRELEPRQRYCATCAGIRKRASKRRHMRLKRGLDVEKRTLQVPQREGADSPKMTIRYPNPQTSNLDSSFSTRPGIAEDASEAPESLNSAGGIR